MRPRIAKSRRRGEQLAGRHDPARSRGRRSGRGGPAGRARLRLRRRESGDRFSPESLEPVGRTQVQGRPGVEPNSAMSTRDPLIDGHGRLIGDLRLSVVDRCNFRCRYCMPADGLPWLDRSEILTFEEITAAGRAVRVHGGRGTEADRRGATGPERVPEAGVDAAPIQGLREISVTTNGYLLERDAEALVRAGVDRFNVSVDSLARDAFFKITRRDALRTGAARARSTRRVPRDSADQGERDRDAGLHRGRGAPLLRAGPVNRLPGALHRVHAA